MKQPLQLQFLTEVKALLIRLYAPSIKSLQLPCIDLSAHGRAGAIIGPAFGVFDGLLHVLPTVLLFASSHIFPVTMVNGTRFNLLRTSTYTAVQNHRVSVTPAIHAPARQLGLLLGAFCHQASVLSRSDAATERAWSRPGTASTLRVVHPAAGFCPLWPLLLLPQAVFNAQKAHPPMAALKPVCWRSVNRTVDRWRGIL